MLAVFYIGILLTIVTLWATMALSQNGYFESIRDSFKDTPFLTVMYFTVQIAGVLMLYFGFVTPSSDISHIIDNKDGTITSIEYSISGDSIVKHKIKAPIEIYGVITNVEHKNRLIGKIFYEHTIVTHKLNDGRTITEKYSYSEFKEKDIKIGNSMKAIETFYPSYNIKFLY